MHYERLVGLFLGLSLMSAGCLSTHQGELVVMHPSVAGNTSSEVWIRTKDINLPFMEFHHIAAIYPKSPSELSFKVLLFSTLKNQVNTRKLNFYLIDDQGNIFKPQYLTHKPMTTKSRATLMSFDVPGQIFIVRLPDGTVKYHQIHYIEDRNLEVEYFWGRCELKFDNAPMLMKNTKFLILVAEGEHRKIMFTWRFVHDERLIPLTEDSRTRARQKAEDIKRWWH